MCNDTAGRELPVLDDADKTDDQRGKPDGDGRRSPGTRRDVEHQQASTLAQREHHRLVCVSRR